jgi:hypothetical protein
MMLYSTGRHFEGPVAHRLRLLIEGLIAFLIAWLWARPIG